MSDGIETLTVKGKKYSWITFIKVLLFAWAIAYIMNAGSYGLVAFNHVMSKAIGLAHNAIDYCANCLQAI